VSVGKAIRNGSGLSSNDWVKICASLETTNARSFMANGGASWLIGGGIYSAYFGSVPPNSPVPDCGTNSFNGLGVFGARSNHSGGVNTVRADGSAHWVSNSINMVPWRSLSTRNSGD